MDENNSQNAFPKKEMFQGNWSCAHCGNPITELPFQPDSERLHQLKCIDCHRKGKASMGGSTRKMFQGSWECSNCKKPITELPFQPDPNRPANNLLCRDCFMGKRTGA